MPLAFSPSHVLRTCLSIVVLVALGCTGSDDGPSLEAQREAPLVDSILGEIAEQEELGGLVPSDVRVAMPWQQGTIVKPPSGGEGTSTLSAVTVETIENFDRIVVEFGDRDPGLGYWSELLDTPPRRCASSIPPESVAEHWVILRMSPAQAHDETGTPTVQDRVQRVDFDNVRGAEIICDFEGAVEVAIALTRPAAYRIIDVGNPDRLIVDVIR